MATARRKHKEAKSRSPKAEVRPRIPGLSSRPVWRGHLRLSLVSCPVALYRATTKANDISFHLVNPDTNNRVRMIPTDPDTGPVERASLVKGYEVAKNRYIMISDEELESHYRRLFADNDAEQLIAQGVPKEFVIIAIERGPLSARPTRRS